MTAPPEEVRRAFGADSEPELLSPTSGGVWRAGALVLKRAGPPVEADFVATLSAQLPMAVDPIRSVGGSWAHEGWTATTWVDARPDPSRWDDVLEVGDTLHRALADLDPPWPAALDARTTPWAVADRVAWGEEALPRAVTGAARSVVEQALLHAVGAARSPAQVVHGDLAGNVLFPVSGPPVVIDLSPYRRPVRYATAIAIVDQACWHGAARERTALVDLADLARAIVFRVVAAALQSAAAGTAEADRSVRLLP